MSTSLPEHPDLDQLRRRAKELRDGARVGDPAALERFARQQRPVAGAATPLAAAQVVIARELGFASWPTLKAAVDAEAGARREISTFLTAAIEGRARQAGDMLRGGPGIAGRSLLAAAVLGDAGAVRERLAVDPDSALTVDDDRGWPPLLYACYSRWHHIEPERQAGVANVARVLLDAGASPNTNDGGRSLFRSALKGAVEVDNPLVTEMLLEAGANPDPGQPIGEAVGHRDPRCLGLLLAHGARVAGTWAVGAAVFHDNAAAMAMLLRALEASGGDAPAAATDALADAAANASLPVVVALLDAGADPDATDDDGVSALRLAVRAGKQDVVARLQDHGASGESTDVDRFLGACIRADRRGAEALLAERPDLRDRMTDDDRAAIFDAAASRPAETVALMLDLGFPPGAGRYGEQPLHTAAYHGNAATVRLLLGAGADVDARDARFDGTPLAFATVGSGERSGRPGDWIETVRLLVEAGADRHDVWVSEKPPSEAVAHLLHHYGITPDEPTAPLPSDEPEVPGSIGTGVMAEMARHLEAAFRHLDLDLLGSLLDPQVHWSGNCTHRTQVLDWFRGLLAEGMRADVESVEVDRDAVVLGLSVGRRAEGARPAEPDRLYQVFTVENALVVEIRAPTPTVPARWPVPDAPSGLISALTRGRPSRCQAHAPPPGCPGGRRVPPPSR